ncbi:hypothetical protein [Sphingobacterium thalpophilum]|uniref:hypothetical protein n=1 Tax=Sphingobacterium thalpophilum TaxID=259 RepID=UPI003C734B81
MENALTSVIAQLKATISTMPNTRDMIILIKPSKEARTKDVVRTIDLLKQQHISRYVIGKPHTDEEKHLLASVH